MGQTFVENAAIGQVRELIVMCEVRKTLLRLTRRRYVGDDARDATYSAFDVADGKSPVIDPSHRSRRIVNAIIDIVRAEQRAIPARLKNSFAVLPVHAGKPALVTPLRASDTASRQALVGRAHVESGLERGIG